MWCSSLAKLNLAKVYRAKLVFSWFSWPDSLRVHSLKYTLKNKGSLLAFMEPYKVLFVEKESLDYLHVLHTKENNGYFKNWGLMYKTLHRFHYKTTCAKKT